MSSKINFNNIDGNYPIAGQDNDSQGFRDNFTNIKTNLRYANEELTDLQNKVVLKSALIGTSLQNDMAFATIFRPKSKGSAKEYRDLGTTSGSAALSFLDAEVQKITTSGPLVLSFTDFPPTGIYGSMRIWISIQFGTGQTSASVNFPTSVVRGISGIPNLTVETNGTKTVTFNAAGDYLFELSSVDAGASYWLIKLA
jgi:hypothetical protein